MSVLSVTRRMKELPERIELRVAQAALRLGRQFAGGPIRRHQPHHEGHRHLEMPGSVAGMTRLDEARHSFAKIQRVELGNGLSHKRRPRRVTREPGAPHSLQFSQNRHCFRPAQAMGTMTSWSALVAMKCAIAVTPPALPFNGEAPRIFTQGG